MKNVTDKYNKVKNMHISKSIDKTAKMPQLQLP